MDTTRRDDEQAASLRRDHRQHEAQMHYDHAQQEGSVERERAALQSLDIQTMQNQMEQLERRVARLEEELQNLAAQRHGNVS